MARFASRRAAFVMCGVRFARILTRRSASRTWVSRSATAGGSAACGEVELMAGIVSAPDGWQQMVRDAIATASRPINVDPRFSPRVTARGAADTANDRGSSPPARAAATLLLLYPAADGSGLVAPITIRHGGLRTHAGEVSLPGGAVDAADADRAATALREAAEEIGLDSVAAGVTVAGALDPIWIPVSSFELLPVVATAARAPHLIPQQNPRWRPSSSFHSPGSSRPMPSGSRPSSSANGASRLRHIATPTSVSGAQPPGLSRWRCSPTSV